MLRCLLSVCVFVLAFAAARATTTVRLPAGTCAADDTVFFDGFSGPVVVPSDPSSGSGGAMPVGGDLGATLPVPGVGTFDYYVHLPAGYDGSQAWPIVVALHGAGSPASHAGAKTQAQATRAVWASLADAEGFIVLAPVSSGSSGGWLTGYDYIGIRAELDVVEASYNVERTRRYLWGFSAGGHVAWDIVLNGADYGTGFDADALAGMAVSAGVMYAAACDPPPSGACDALVASLERRLPIDLHVGLGDLLLPYVRHDRDLLLTHGWHLGRTLGYHEFSGSHAYTAAHLGQAWAGLCRYARD